ncbi:MAG: hypothetical protein ACOYLF_05735, partial [Blastocatellia bacterium]
MALPAVFAAAWLRVRSERAMVGLTRRREGWSAGTVFLLRVFAASRAITLRRAKGLWLASREDAKPRRMV